MAARLRKLDLPLAVRFLKIATGAAGSVKSMMWNGQLKRGEEMLIWEGELEPFNSQPSFSLTNQDQMELLEVAFITTNLELKPPVQSALQGTQ